MVRRSVVLVLGESDHDRKAIRHLAEGLRADLRGKVETRSTPIVLIKNAGAEKARTNAQKIAELARQEQAARNVLAVLAHEDCDDLEPAHIDAARRIEDALQQAGCPAPAYAVTPAWEIEAWWMIFPEAVASVVTGWREPIDWIGKEVGRVENAKERLAEAVRPRRRLKKAPRDYAERDSIQIAAAIVDRDLLTSFADGRRTTPAGANMRHTRSASFEAFRLKVRGIRTPPEAEERR